MAGQRRDARLARVRADVPAIPALSPKEKDVDARHKAGHDVLARRNPMSANNTLHIAVLAGDGIGPEVMAVALEVLRKIEAQTDLKFRFTEAAAGANHYLATGTSMPESTVRLCAEVDAILLGACGLPSVRYPDNTEIAPQIELRMHFDLYAGVRPARLIPGVPSPIIGAAERGIDLVVIRESTEGLFASMGKGVVTEHEARETLLITRKTSERLFTFSFRLAKRRRARGRAGALTCVDKANVFKAFAFFREMFDEAARLHPDVKADRLYVDACAMMLVKRPWDFDVLVTENMFGDILSDLAAGLIGGMGMAPSADFGDHHAVFQPCHGTAPDIMGQGKANPTAMILSAAMMLDWFGERHGLEQAVEASERITRAVDQVYAAGLKPFEFGGHNGTADIANAVLAAL
jgi:3-isopropylmalate dehydrogenase